MSHVQFIDELIREYLLFRGFSGTLKVFDAELKVDKDKGFRVDKIVEQLVQFINAYDLNSLRELWLHLDQKMFSKLEHHFSPAVRKLENAVLKMYVVNAVVNNKPEKVAEFFSKMTPDLQNQPEWKEWFMLPFIRYPEENPSFALHFTRQWQDTLLVSLHNFLAMIFQCMPQPTLCSYEEDAIRMKKLQDENEALKLRVAMLLDSTRGASTVTDLAAVSDVPQQTELMDDFYVIAQEALSSSSDTQSKTLKNLIRNIGSGLPTSPILSRKVSQQPVTAGSGGGSKKLSSSLSVDEQQQHHKRHSSKQRQSSTPAAPTWGSSTTSSSKPEGTPRKRPEPRKTPREPSVESLDRKMGHISLSKVEVPPPVPSAFLLLSQEEYTEHRSSISHCKFNSTGSAVASADVDGVIKLWSTTPSPRTLATFVTKSSVLALDWVRKNERYLITGHKLGLVRLYDTWDNKMVWELGSELTSPLRDCWVVDVCCHPMESSFVCSTVGSQGSGPGKLLLYDIKTRKLERSLPFDSPSLVANCCTFNHNGQMLFAGCSDGTVRIYDLRRGDCIDVWSSHQGSVEAIQLSSGFTSCYTLARDGKFCQNSLNGQVLWETVIPDASALQNVPSPHGQLFTCEATGTYIFICGPLGGNIFQLGAGLTRVLELGGHRSPVLAADWAIANQSATCITASSEGKIRVSTLLTP
ncbi:WD repeat-containing protein 91 [Anabrus simplex]|uniref:WD repeat-containing protein 91 n=1 Tax=Anabrus simplex TaxID=316456 RepID=UPI0035A3D49E